MKTMTQDFMPCVEGAFDGGLHRAAYYDGMVLGAADLLREQKYWRMKRMLTNRALGHGIVWGLGVEWDPKLRRFVVCPGYGLSCCGDDLIVECPEIVGERHLIDPCSEAFRRLITRGLDPCLDGRHPDAPVEAALLLEYVECLEDPRRVYEDPCAQTPKGCRYGAVRETVRLTLVPPPPKPDCGPIAGFLKAVADVRAELKKAGVAMPDPMAAPADLATEVRLTTIGATGTTTVGGSGKLTVAQGETLRLRFDAAAGSKLRVAITPPPGYFCSKATFKGVEAPIGDTLMGWSSEINPAVAGNDRAVTLEFVPLFGGGTSYEVLYQFAPIATAPELLVTAAEVTTREFPPDCASLLRDGLLCAGDTAGTLRTLALATLYGWVAGALSPATCAEPIGPAAKPDAPDPARVALAWTICWMAWKALFGIDISAAGASGLQACLRRLFAEWCDGFHYKGPHCDENSHGIILGSVQISPKGKILCFDEWAYRRHVLTGPLLTHWGSQFGLAPLDVVAGRLAGWICCVAGARLPDPAAAPNTAAGAAFPMGTAMMAVARALPEGSDFNGMKIARRREVGAFDFMQGIARALTQDHAATAGATEAMVVASRSLDMALVMPVAPQQRPVIRSIHPIEAELATMKAATPAMARQPMVDYVATLADNLPLAALKPETESPLFAPMVAALGRAGVNSAGELVAIGPEAAAARARADLINLPAFGDAPSVDRAMALVYDRAIKTLASAGKVIADEALARGADEAFTRAELPDVTNKVQQALRPMLGQPASLAMLRAVAAQASTAPSG